MVSALDATTALTLAKEKQRLQPTFLLRALCRSRSSKNGPHLASTIAYETGLVKATTEPKAHVLQHREKRNERCNGRSVVFGRVERRRSSNPVPDKNLNRLAAKERALRKGWIVPKRKVRDPACGGQIEVFRVTDAGRARLEELGARNGAVERFKAMLN
ncbi:hypothetical protein [Bradyrhizobium sp. S3.2.12]|uniref:hypothetical protein n=1 Tax=Bradyrhizobium sp. S3.2.12 TaxID=3156387 RepID=UPI0033963CAF